LPKFPAQVRIIRAHVDSGRRFGRQATGSPEENKAAGAFHFECVIGFFSHFDFEMRFAPQPRALFQQINFQKRSNTEVLFAL
jgi:hypothetical protein